MESKAQINGPLEGVDRLEDTIGNWEEVREVRGRLKSE